MRTQHPTTLPVIVSARTSPLEGVARSLRAGPCCCTASSRHDSAMRQADATRRTTSSPLGMRLCILMQHNGTLYSLLQILAS